mmetsp:Transcript_71463/g.157858  ORF Transcript_71463/g.157858 Transcript_71463/m.157858 type:complete len:200 (+) Transcript_71463:166-765(+)
MSASWWAGWIFLSLSEEHQTRHHAQDTKDITAQLPPGSFIHLCKDYNCTQAVRHDTGTHEDCHHEECLIVLQAQRDEVEIRGRKKHRCCQGDPRDRMKPCYAVSTEALLQQHRNDLRAPHIPRQGSCCSTQRETTHCRSIGILHQYKVIEAEPGNKAQAIDHGAGRKKDMLHVLCAPIHFVDLSEEHRCCGSEENNGSG